MTHSPAAPFFLPGSDTGCLLIHGFAGLPSEMRGLGDSLAARGYTVLGVRLAGHGGTPEDLRAAGWRAWLHSAAAGLAELRQHCSRIVVIGFSLGGALAILLNQQQSFDRLVLLATPLKIQGDWRLNLLPLARYIIPWYYPLENADLSDPFTQQRLHELAPDADLADPATRETIRRSARISVAAIDELQQALQRARARVPAVRVPTLIMHGRQDDVAPLESAEELLRRLGSKDKLLIWWAETGHQMLVVGPHRQIIYERVAQFVDAGAQHNER